LNGPPSTSLRGDLPGRAWGRSSLPALAGLIPPVAALTLAEGPALWLRLCVLAIVTVGWQLVFARLRRQPIDPHGLVTAALVALAVPAGAPLWQLLLGISFGVVIGEQVFGGRGRSFLHPAVVTLAFLMFSFTDQDYRAGPELGWWTVLPALLLLLVAGQVSWRLLAAAAAALVLLLAVQGAAEPWTVLLDGAVLMVLVFLAADPVASAATNPGRWIYGALVGALAGLFGQVGAIFGSTVFAILLASIFAPLIDQLVIALHGRWREGRRG